MEADEIPAQGDRMIDEKDIVPISAKGYWSQNYERLKSRAGRGGLPRPWKYRTDYELSRFFDQVLPRVPGLRLIELGCGNSIWLPFFAARYGYDVFGWDYSEPGCRLAKAYLEHQGVVAKVVCGSVLELPEKLNGRFDIVYSHGLIEHFRPPLLALSVKARLAAPGGLVITVVPNLRSWPGRVLKFMEPRFYEMHEVIDACSLRKYCEACNLAVIDSRYIRFADLGILGLGEWPQLAQRWGGRLITAMNLLWLYEMRLCRFNPQHKNLSAFLIMVGKRRVAIAGDQSVG